MESEIMNLPTASIPKTPFLEKILLVINKIYSSSAPEIIQEDRKYPIFPFEKTYVGQNDAIDALLNSNYILLCSHTGSGKTAVYLTAALLDRYRTAVIVPRVFLQDQIERDYNEKFKKLLEDDVIFSLKGRERYSCKFGRVPIGRELCFPCEARYYSREKKRYVFDVNNEQYPYPCPGCEFEQKKERAISKYVEGNGIICLNQGNFWFIRKLKKDGKEINPEFVVIDEADEFARAITQGFELKNDERELMIERAQKQNPSIAELLRKMNRDEILAMNDSSDMLRQCLDLLFEVLQEQLQKLTERIVEIEGEIENASKKEKEKLKEDLVMLRRIAERIRNKIEKVGFFRRNIDKVFVYMKKTSRNIYFEMFLSEEELITRLFRHAKKLCVVTATPFETEKFVKISYEIPFKARVIYAPVGKLTCREIFFEGNTDLLEKAVTDYIIPIHEYVSSLLGLKAKTPIHCGSLQRHGTFVADILKNNGKSVILHEEGKLDKTIEMFRDGDYDFLCVVAAEYGGDWYWCPLQFVLKVPYANPFDPRELAIKRRFGEELQRKRYEWDALSRLIQACGRNARKPEQFSVSIILDKKFEELYHKYNAQIPSWFKNRLIWLGGVNGSGMDSGSEERTSAN